MTETAKPRILFVDDEPDLLAALSRTLRSERFTISTAGSGSAALKMLRDQGPFAVIVSDLRMPEIDGIALLEMSRACSPDTVRVLFTGQPDMEHAIAAVNKGAIFRFIVKPSNRISLALTLNSAIEQHSLVTAERILLEKTLRGSIKALVDVLSLAAPMAFGRATRVRQTVRSLQAACGIGDGWHVEVAAMLSQVGCVILPPATIEKIHRAEVLTEAEEGMVQRMPAITEQVLGNIPRLEPVLEILHFQGKHFDGGGSPPGGPRGAEIPWGARALKLSLDLDALENEGLPPSQVFDTLRGREGRYDPEMLQKLAELRNTLRQGLVREMSIANLRAGMVLAQDVRTRKGVLFIARGQEVTPSLLERLRNCAGGIYRDDEIRVVVGEGGA